MRPDTVMKYKDGDDIDKLLEKWIKVYEQIGEDYPEKYIVAEKLIERIRTAHKLLAAGNTEDDESLDGDFMLGNERDMEFANRFFDIDELADMQVGYPWFADFQRYEEYVDETDIRKGFVEELRGDYVEAIRYYKKVGDKKLISERLAYAQKRNDEEAENYYRKAWSLIKEGKYKDANVCYYLMRAADMGHLEAQTDYAIYQAYGIDGAYQCVDEAKELMKKAAEAGDERARKLIDDGFDGKSEYDFMLELAEKGDTGAMYRLVSICEREGKADEASEWLIRSIEEECPDALYDVACQYMNEKEPELLQIAAEYLYKAAMRGHADAMYRCAEQLEKGSATVENSKTILEFYEKAADGGVIDAVERLYQIYKFGTEFAEPDKQKASYYAFISGRYRD